MAVDLSQKKVFLAQNLILQAGNLVALYYAIKKFCAQNDKGNVSYVAKDFDNTVLKNVDPQDMGNLITRLTEFTAWYETVIDAKTGERNCDILLKVQDGSH